MFSHPSQWFKAHSSPPPPRFVYMQLSRQLTDAKTIAANAFPWRLPNSRQFLHSLQCVRGMHSVKAYFVFLTIFALNFYMFQSVHTVFLACLHLHRISGKPPAFSVMFFSVFMTSSTVHCSSNRFYSVFLLCIHNVFNTIFFVCSTLLFSGLFCCVRIYSMFYRYFWRVLLRIYGMFCSGFFWHSILCYFWQVLLCISKMVYIVFLACPTPYFWHDLLCIYNMLCYVFLACSTVLCIFGM